VQFARCASVLVVTGGAWFHATAKLKR
jgi:hypothetical protein